MRKIFVLLSILGCWSTMGMLAQGAAMPTAMGREHTLPIVFEPVPSDSGQILMQARDGQRTFLLRPDGLSILPAGGAKPPLQIIFRKSSSAAPTGLDLRSSRTNYLIGNDPSRWRTQVANYDRAVYHDLYPGIDAVFYGSGNALEHDFVVSPGANYHAIELQFPARTQLTLGRNGALQIRDGAEAILLAAPVVYQVQDRHRVVRQGKFHLLGANTVGFTVTHYDATRSLIIDPVLTFATYVASTSGNTIAAGLDAQGNNYITGSTGADFQVTSGTFTSCSGCAAPNAQVFISKLSPDGTKLLYSTILGGDGGAQPTGLAVDAGGNVVVAGISRSTNFPTSHGQTVSQLQSNTFGFLLSLSPDGSSLNYSTLLGSSPSTQFGSDTNALALALDAGGDAFVTGITGNGFPITQGALNAQTNASTYGNTFNVFLAKFSPKGDLIYSAVPGVADPQNGGGGLIGPTAVSVDKAGNAFLAGEAGTLWPTTAGAYLRTIAGAMPYAAPFVTKVAPDGASLVYSTFLDPAYGVTSLALSQDGSVLIAGNSPEGSYPTTPDAFAANNGMSGAFITRLNAAGSALLYSSVFGDNTFTLRGLALSADGTLWLAGQTQNSQFPTVHPLQQIFPQQQLGATRIASVVSQLDPALKVLQFSTFLGGNAGGYAQSVAVDANGHAHVAGSAIYGMFTTSGVVTPSVPVPGQGFTESTFPYLAVLDPSVPAPSLCLTPNTQLQFSGVALNGFAETQLTVTDCGNAALTLGSPSASSPPFSVPAAENKCTNTLDVGQSCTFSVRYAPVTAQVDAATLSLPSNASEATQTLALSGTGVVAPFLQVSAASLTFAPQLVGTASPTQSVTLTNLGQAAANVLQIGISEQNGSDFSVTNNCGTTLAAGASCTLTVGFTPQFGKSVAGTLSVIDSGDQPLVFQNVSLVGTGITSGFALTSAQPGSVTATVTAGQTASYSLALALTNGYKGTLTLACGALPQNATCTLNPSSLNATAGSTQAVAVMIGTQMLESSASGRSGSKSPLWFAVFLVPAVFWRRRSLLGVLSLVVVLTFTGCGKAGSSGSTPPAPVAAKVAPGTYNVTVTATDGTNQSAQVLTLIVQ